MRVRSVEGPTSGVMLAAGSHQTAVRSIVAPFEEVAFVYLRLAGAPSEEERDLRSRHAAEKLHAHGASETAAAVIAARIAAAPPAPATLAVFVSQDGRVLHEQVLADAEVADHAGCQSPAPVTPLLAWGQDRPAYVLVVTDRAGGDITAGAGAGQPDQAWTVVGPDDEIERKRGPGGWSQPSYQRRVEDSWRHNAASVAEQVVTHAAAVDAQVLVLSGDVRAVRLLSERLPNDPALLVRHISGSRAADGSQAGRDSRVDQVLREAAAAQTARLLEELHERLAPGGLGVEGIYDTLAALARGRVATLLVQDTPTDSRTAWFAAGPADVYPDREAAVVSNAPVRSGRLIDIAVRSALLSDAHVRVIPQGTPGQPADGIGALCRYGTR